MGILSLIFHMETILTTPIIEEGVLLVQQLNLNLGSVLRIMWQDKQTRDEWEPRLSAVQRLGYQLELESVARGLRRITTVNVPPQTFELEIERFNDKKLIFVPIKRVKKYQGFAHRHNETDGNDPDSYVFGVVCKELTHGRMAKSLLIAGDHRSFGEMLGYPECCREFFHREFVQNGIPDLPWCQGLNTPAVEHTDTYRKIQGSAYLNMMLRYWSVRLAPHLPCSYRCASSVAWVESVWLPLAQSIDAVAADDLLRLLSMPTQFDVNKGVAIITTPLFKGVASSIPCAIRHVLDFSTEAF